MRRNDCAKKINLMKRNKRAVYLRKLITDAGLSQAEMARKIEVSERMMEYYLQDNGRYAAPVKVVLAVESVLSKRF